MRAIALRLNFSRKMPGRRRGPPYHGNFLGFAGTATFGFVLETFFVEENLFTGGEDEICSAVDALEDLILKLHWGGSWKLGSTARFTCMGSKSPAGANGTESCNPLNVSTGLLLGSATMRPTQHGSQLYNGVKGYRFGRHPGRGAAVERCINPALYEPFSGCACVPKLPSHASFRRVSGKRSAAWPPW